MYLQTVQLINWRSYRSQKFHFPLPHDNKNVVLVQAPNEYGKTSFFEAVTLGLFGKDGLNLVPRKQIERNGGFLDHHTASYSKFLQGAINKQAIKEGRSECVVKLEWEDEFGNPIEIKRTWYFTSNGNHKINDDQLQIYDGKNRNPVTPPSTESDTDRWYREWVAQRFISPSLAEFFLFDGEQVQRYATQEMRHQVRSAIEGLLGLPTLRNLKESLAKYAQYHRKSAALPSDNKVKLVNEDILRLENTIKKKTVDRDNASARLPSLKIEMDKLMERLGGRPQDTVSLIANLMEDERRHEEEARRVINDLWELISGDIALALSGTSLRTQTITCLEAEAKREAWEIDRNAASRNLDRFSADLSERIESLKPTINSKHRKAIIKAAKEAWDALWHPPPNGCADEYLHKSLTGKVRNETIDRLLVVDHHTADEISNHVYRFDTASSTADAKKRERIELEQATPEIEELTKRLSEFSTEYGKFENQKDEAQREIDAATVELGEKRAELGRYMASKNKHTPALLYADRADAYAKLIDDLLEEAVPTEVGKVANEMTKAWKAMAHMSGRVSRIEISSDCEVKLLASDGSDLNEIEKSAGANQVFTQALIIAITKVSGQTFPFIVDTPIARLSRDHRLGVLKTFTERPGQVILLSTDQEVVDDKLDVIRKRIMASYELKATYNKEGITDTTIQDLDLGSV